MKSPLRAERERRGLTLKAVAHAVSMDQGNLSRVERGEQLPSKELIEALCKYFDGAVTELEIIFPERFANLPQDISRASGDSDRVEVDPADIEWVVQN